MGWHITEFSLAGTIGRLLGGAIAGAVLAVLTHKFFALYILALPIALLNLVGADLAFPGETTEGMFGVFAIAGAVLGAIAGALLSLHFRPAR